MKLHDILYGAAIIFVLIGIAGIDGWMFNGTSICIPLVLLVVAAVLWYIAAREDGRIRKRRTYGYFMTRRRKT